MKKILTAGVLGLLLSFPGLAETPSLSNLFTPGITVLDLDGDGYGDKIALSIIVPDKPGVHELCLAADIAARINLESLSLDFGLVRRESEASDRAVIPFPVLLGDSLAQSRAILKEYGIRPGSLAPNQGLVLAFEHGGRPGLLCVAGSAEALLRTGRAYFLRWPYFWEIWGRETGATYFSLEKDIRDFLAELKAGSFAITVRKALYEFPEMPAVRNALQSLAFDDGQVKNLTVEIRFAEPADQAEALRALELLRDGQKKGLRTSVLSYPGCAGLTLELRSGQATGTVGLKRMGATKRLLSPGFKPRPGAEPSGKEFDLTGLFATGGFYSDQDRDGLPDGLDSSVVLPPGLSGPGIADLTTRLVLDTAGASFPIARLDSEIESRKELPAPILVGANALTKDLVRTGRFKLPEMRPGQGAIWVVPKAFGKSNALVIDGADGSGLEKTLAFFSRTFPFLDEYGQGRPQVRDVLEDFEDFLEGDKGAAEAFFSARLGAAIDKFKGKDLESLEARILLSRENGAFREVIERRLKDVSGYAGAKAVVESLKSGREVFRAEKQLAWEVDEALALIEAELAKVKNGGREEAPLKISLGVSESLPVRMRTKDRIEELLRKAGVSPVEAEVLSAYKPGFFWLRERILPRLREEKAGRVLIRFAEEREDLTRPKRSYAEPARWLQELYPIDDIIAREAGLPLEKIDFEMKDGRDPTYEVLAYGSGGEPLFEESFSPRVRELPFLAVLPEWGTVRVTTGWLRMERGTTVLFDGALRTDLENFWSFFQEDVLGPVYTHVLRKTGQEPTFSKQPYFKRLLVDVQLSEPDVRLALDEEIVSSLEALHDEVYFDTLDFLRGITRFDPEDQDLPPDASRSSAPGNVMPIIRPSLEGGGGKVKAVLEDWPGRTPLMTVEWKEKGREKTTERIPFPALKPKSLKVAGLVFDGNRDRIERLALDTDWEKEADYLAVLDILEAHRRLQAEALVPDPFRYPGLDGLQVRLRNQDREKEEGLAVTPREREGLGPAPLPAPKEPFVPTREIIPPSLCLDLVGKLGRFENVRAYTGGKSYEGRDVPVLELYLPLGKYVSLPRLVTFKPTLQLVGRQHANEVSSTNYLLKFAEIMARDGNAREALKKINIVLQPMENPDGAELAFELHQIEPFHSLHAGRYGSLGVDIGYQAGGRRPLLPEAAVRATLSGRWFPDVLLNLHGYPSHEWVQPFSNYTPYLFRDYWIPKGWFTYYRSLSLPLYEKWKEAGEDLMGFIIRELQADGRIAESNRKFYDRYERWAGRWAPHIHPLELYGGVNIFAKRRSSSESRLSPRTQITYVVETPELMDETATGEWLDFLCDQGLAYLRAHVRYLTRAEFPVVRLEEEGRDRVRVTFLRGRPGKVRPPG